MHDGCEDLMSSDDRHLSTISLSDRSSLQMSDALTRDFSVATATGVLGGVPMNTAEFARRAYLYHALSAQGRRMLGLNQASSRGKAKRCQANRILRVSIIGKRA